MYAAFGITMLILVFKDVKKRWYLYLGHVVMTVASVAKGSVRCSDGEAAWSVAFKERYAAAVAAE